MSKRYAGGIVSAVFKPLDSHGDLSPMFIFGGELNGTLGLNLGGTVYRSSPTQIGTSTDWYKGFVSSPSIRAGAIKQNGTMWVWGNSENGQLGLNGIAQVSSPTQVGALTTWSQMTVRQNTSLAIKTDGSLWVWGASNFGQLGQNDVIYRSSPVQVGSDYWTDAGGGGNHIGAIRSDGTLWTWGRAQTGQTGQNTGAPTPIQRSSPVQVGTDTNWSIIDGGAASWCAIRTNGTLWSCGYGSLGQLGNNGTDNRSSPVQIGALTTWSACGQGGRYGSAIRNDGTLWSWGVTRIDSYGVLGINLVDDAANKSSPVQVGTDTNWSKVFCNDLITVAIKTDGTMWSWGSNGEGAGGTNTNIYRSSPVQVGAGTNWGIAIPGRTSLAIEAS